MGRWDKKESETDKKIEDFMLRGSEKQNRAMPEFMKKWSMKLSIWIYNHGIQITLRQWIMMIIGTQIFVWVILPAMVGHIELGFDSANGEPATLDSPIRIIILIITLLFYFAVERGDGSSDKDPPPSDDSGDSSKNRDEEHPWLSPGSV